VISNVLKCAISIKELSLEQLEQLPGYQNLSISEQLDLQEKYLLLEKKPKKIIIHRN
jgi:hypothetical protein